jgi:formylglycine-generating enzyme required for sulfatase activity
LARKTRLDFSLPTEAEWEYACRAGTTTPFHFGSVLDGTQANCDGKYPYGTKKKGSNLERPTPVGSYAANAWGLYDVHGNLWEWCADGYLEDLIGLPAVDSSNFKSSNSPYVLRGGSWYLDAWYCRAARRARSDPSNRDYDFGFRVALRLD